VSERPGGTLGLAQSGLGACEGVLERLHGEIHLVGVYDQWRREADGRFPAAQEHKPASEAFLNDAVAQFHIGGERLAVADDFDADHQAQAAHVCDAVGVSLGHLLEAAFQAIAHEAGVLDEAVLQQLERRECCRDGHRIPSEGGGVGTRGPAHHIGACDGDPKGKSRRDAFGDGHDVRHKVEVFARPQATGAPHPRLHLIGDDEDAVGLAQAIQPVEETARGDDVSPLALNRLDDDGGHFLWRNGRLEDNLLDEADAGLPDVLSVGLIRVPKRIRVGDVRDIQQLTAEAAPLRRLAAGQREGAERAAVEASIEGDELIATCGIAGDFQGALDSFCSGISEVHPLGEIARGDLLQLLRQVHEVRVVVVGRSQMDEFCRLPRDGLHDLRMRVAGVADGDARIEVEEVVPVHVLDDGAESAADDERIGARVGRRDISRVLLHDLSSFRSRKLGLDVRQFDDRFHSVSSLWGQDIARVGSDVVVRRGRIGLNRRTGLFAAWSA
jgi:hypothetical protein